MEFATAMKIPDGITDFTVLHGGDNQLIVEFENLAIKNEYESQQQNRPIFQEVPYIKIISAGNTKSVVHRRVQLDETGNAPSDPQRFPRQWQQFLNKQEQTFDGTPITEWSPLTKSQALELKGINIHTVEHLANVTDAVIDKLGLGGQQLREQARTWLKQADGGKEVSRLTAENTVLKASVDDLKKQVADLASLIEKKTTPEEKGTK